jgi:hypothetical protein
MPMNDSIQHLGDDTFADVVAEGVAASPARVAEEALA